MSQDRLGLRNNASSRLSMKAPVARSNTRLRFIFGLKVKSKLSSVLLGSRKAASLRRRSSSRSDAPGQARRRPAWPVKSIGAMGSACPAAAAFPAPRPYHRGGAGAGCVVVH